MERADEVLSDDTSNVEAIEDEGKDGGEDGSFLNPMVLGGGAGGLLMTAMTIWGIVPFASMKPAGAHVSLL